jgi:hypothetical protein
MQKARFRYRMAPESYGNWCENNSILENFGFHFCERKLA